MKLWTVDIFTGMEWEPVGVFSTEEKAKNAKSVLIGNKKIIHDSNFIIKEVTLDEINTYGEWLVY